MDKVAFKANKKLNKDKKQLAFAPSSLILANNFLPVNWALYTWLWIQPMRTKILIITLAFFIQGCTVLGMVMDSKFPSKNENDKSESFTEMGLKSDFELAKSVIYDEPLPGNEPKKLTGCKELKGKKQVECYKVSNQLSKSLQKHVKQ